VNVFKCCSVESVRVVLCRLDACFVCVVFFCERLLSESSVRHNETDALRGLVLASLRERRQLLDTGHHEKVRTHRPTDCLTQSALCVLAESIEID
jgi:hypothetical protein